MRWERTDSFRADYRRLSHDERAMFRRTVVAFNEACDAFVASGGDPSTWPARLRVKSIRGAPGVMGDDLELLGA